MKFGRTLWIGTGFAIGLATSASMAHAVEDVPLGCPELVEVQGGYLLTQDATCSLSGWTEDGTVLDLGGHTLTGRLFPLGSNQVVRNGNVVLRGEDYWAQAHKFTVSGVTLEPLTPDPCGFCIEAGSWLTVEYSTFRNFNGIALDFYFGNGGTIRYSTFAGNFFGVSVQSSNGVLIEHTTFSDNNVGVNLFPEDGAGVNEITIRYNTFQDNQKGINVSSGFSAEGMNLSHNIIEKNQFEANGESGIVIALECAEDYACVWPADNTINGNHFLRNGYDSSAQFTDGITATGSVLTEYPEALTEYPEALAGFTLSGNRADRNMGLGLNVLGVTDGGGNSAKFNGNPAQCIGVGCKTPRGAAGVQAEAGTDVLTPQLSHDRP